MERERTKAGHVVDGRFRLEKLVGGGSAATVWLAEDTHAKTEVAIKLLHPRFRPIPEVVERFKRESQLLSELKHPAIADILGQWSEGTSQPYIVLEYVAGKTLDHHLQIRAIQNNHYPLDEILRIFAPLCSAVALAHARGVVHRDLKPSNIMITDQLEVKVLDFGVAKLLDAAPHDQTTRGRQLGTYAYMSPEEADAEAIDVRSDVFALGSILFEILTLRYAWMRGTEGAPLEVGGESFDSPTDILARIQSGIPPLPSPLRSDLSDDVDQTVATALALQPEKRFQTVAAFHESLQNALVGAAAISEPVQLTEIVGSQHRLQDSGLEATTPARPPVVAKSEEDTMPAELRQEVASRVSSEEREVAAMLGVELRGYRILEHLGSGTFAHVFRAQHTHLNRQAAVKILRGEFAASETVSKRMSREADALSRLSHPNIVAVLDFGILPQERRPFIVMELLEGRTLSAAIGQEAPFDPTRIAQLSHQIASGLIAAHQLEFVHRDLKPGNIVIVSDKGMERVKILDFGIARAMAQEHERTRLTRANEMLGTPAYMAPEQIFGASSVGPKADLYALGVIMFAMVAGRPPFGGNPSELLMKLQTEPPPPVPDAGPLEPLIHALLSKHPEERPESAQDVAQQLETTVSGLHPVYPVHPAHQRAASAGPPPKRTNLFQTLGIAGAFVFSLIALLTVLLREPRNESPPTVPVIQRPIPEPTTVPSVGAQALPAQDAQPTEAEMGTDPVVTTTPMKEPTRTKRTPTAIETDGAAPKIKKQDTIKELRRLLSEVRKNPGDHAGVRRLEKRILARAAQIEDAQRRARIERITVSSAMVGELDGLARAIDEIAAAR